MKVTAVDKKTAAAAECTIANACKGLSQEEVNRMIAEAEKFAEEDQRRKAKVELRNMADQVVYQTRRTLEESADKLDDSDVDPVKAH